MGWDTAKKAFIVARGRCVSVCVCPVRWAPLKTQPPPSATLRHVLPRYLDPSVGTAAAASSSPSGGAPGCVLVTELHLGALNPGVAQEQLAAVRDHLATESNLWGRSV